MAKLVELDWSGIEAVLVGWFSRDPAYIRLAWLGVHDFLTSHAVNRPASLDWPIEDLLRYFAEIKKTQPEARDQSKRIVHGCLPGDHEVLTPAGWVHFDQLKPGTPVAQWDKGEISFVVPKITHLPTTDSLVELRGRGLQIQMTSQHRVPVSTGAAIKERFAAELPTQGKIPITGTLSAGYVDWCPQLALSVAVQADGTTYGRHCVFHLVKPRKVERLLSLLKAANIPRRDVPCGCHPGGHRIRFCLPAWAEDYGGRYGLLQHKTKLFSLPTLMNLTTEARREFLAELLLWDGSVSGARAEYLTTEKRNAVVVQTITHLTGGQALLRVRQPDSAGHWGVKPVYCVSFNRRRWASIDRLERKRLPEATQDVYCVTVPSSYFLVRWRDTISVTGNTNYLESVAGIYKRFRKLFPSFRDAERLQALYYSIASRLHPWQTATIELAAKQEFLGGSGPTGFPWIAAHPFRYRHEFYDVYNYRQVTAAEAQKHRRLGQPTSEMGGRHYLVTRGDDAKRAVAYPAQSSAAGIIRETALWLYDPEAPNFIGDLFHGQTPLRAVIHDSFLNEVEDRHVDRLIERSCAEMTRMFEQFPLPAEWGLGEFLQFGVEVKVGRDWAHMEKVPVPQPWLALLKGRPDDPAAGLLDLGDRGVVDEVEDSEDHDDTYDAPSEYEFGDGWSGDTYRGEPAARESADSDSDSDIPF